MRVTRLFRRKPKLAGPSFEPLRSNLAGHTLVYYARAWDKHASPFRVAVVRCDR